MSLKFMGSKIMQVFGFSVLVASVIFSSCQNQNPAKHTPSENPDTGNPNPDNGTPNPDNGEQNPPHINPLPGHQFSYDVHENYAGHYWPAPVPNAPIIPTVIHPTDNSGDQASIGFRKFAIVSPTLEKLQEDLRNFSFNPETGALSWVGGVTENTYLETPFVIPVVVNATYQDGITVETKFTLRFTDPHVTYDIPKAYDFNEFVGKKIKLNPIVNYIPKENNILYEIDPMFKENLTKIGLKIDSRTGVIYGTITSIGQTKVENPRDNGEIIATPRECRQENGSTQCESIGYRQSLRPNIVVTTDKLEWPDNGTYTFAVGSRVNITGNVSRPAGIDEIGVRENGCTAKTHMPFPNDGLPPNLFFGYDSFRDHNYKPMILGTMSPIGFTYNVEITCQLMDGLTATSKLTFTPNRLALKK